MMVLLEIGVLHSIMILPKRPNLYLMLHITVVLKDLLYLVNRVSKSSTHSEDYNLFNLGIILFQLRIIGCSEIVPLCLGASPQYTK